MKVMVVLLWLSVMEVGGPPAAAMAVSHPAGYTPFGIDDCFQVNTGRE
jgi:hypothetical protein